MYISVFLGSKNTDFVNIARTLKLEVWHKTRDKTVNTYLIRGRDEIFTCTRLHLRFTWTRRIIVRVETRCGVYYRRRGIDDAFINNDSLERSNVLWELTRDRYRKIDHDNAEVREPMLRETDRLHDGNEAELKTIQAMKVQMRRMRKITRLFKPV